MFVNKGWNFGRQDLQAGTLLGLRNMAMSDALASGVGARASAQRMAGDDPSLAAYGGLSALLSGQSRASNMVGMGRLRWMQERQKVLDQMRLMKYQQKLQKEMQPNALMGTLGNIGGMALGSWLAPGGWWAGKTLGAASGGVGSLAGQANINSYLDTLYGGGGEAGVSGIDPQLLAYLAYL